MRAARSSSGSSSWPSSPGTSTSSSRSASRGYASRWRPGACPLARWPDRRGATRGGSPTGPGARRGPLGDLPGCPRGPRDRGRRDPRLRPDPRAPRGAPTALLRRDLPGPDAARGRSRTSVPVHLDAEPVDRRRPASTRRPVSECFARVKVPQILPRLLEVAPSRFVLIDQVIEANLDALFTGMEILEHHLFRVTRNADLALEEDEADDLLMAIEEELRRRRFGEAVRVEVERSMPAATRNLLLRGLGSGRRRLLRDQRHARPDRPAPAHRAAPTGPPDAVLDAGDAAPAPAARRGRAHRHVRGDPGRRHPRPSPVRVVHRIGRALHHPGGGRSRCPLDQADAVPDVR